MFCLKCGEAIPDNSEHCPKCNTSLLESQANEQAVVYASQKAVVRDKFIQAPTAMKKPPKPVVVVSVILVIIAVFFGLNEIQKGALKKELLRDWLDTDGTILRVLDFSDTKIEYNLETGYSYLDTAVAKYDYKVVSGNKIKIKRYGDKYEPFIIEFNDEKTMLTVKPAITSVDSSEYWFNFD